MLNEWQEYACCLSEDTCSIPLQQSALEGKDGFRRLLRILAKGFLQKCEKYGLDTAESIGYCRGFLQTWVEGSNSENLNIPEHCEELLADMEKAESYSLMWHATNLQMESLKKSKDREEKLAERKAKLEDGVKRFGSRPYQKSWNLARNDFNCIYYDQIIADALNRKPLRNQCFALKKREEYGISCHPNLRKIALAVVCMYLQDMDEYDRPVSSAYLPLVQAEIGNWIHVRVNKNGKSADLACIANAMEYSKLMANKAIPLFEKQKLVSGIRIKVNRRWLQENDAKLIDAETATSLSPEYAVFYDAFFMS